MSTMSPTTLVDRLQAIGPSYTWLQSTMLLTGSCVVRDTLFGGSGITMDNALSCWPYTDTHAWIVQVTSLNSMSGILEDALREYNETYATMDLVLFEDAMKHVRYELRCACVFSPHIMLPSLLPM